MFYFDIDNPAHLLFAVLVPILIACGVVLAVYNNTRRPIPFALPERKPTFVCDSDLTPTSAENDLMPALADNEPAKRDLVEIFVIAPEYVPYAAMFRIVININKFKAAGVVEDDSHDWEALIASLRQGDQVGLILQCSDLSIDTPYQALNWDQRNHVAFFNVRAPKSKTEKASSLNRLLVMVGGYPIGEIEFSIQFVGVGPAEETIKRPADPITLNNISREILNLPIAEKGFKARKFASAFISYSRENTKEMALFCSGLDTHDVDIKLDRFEFRTGETWVEQAKQHIEQCDVFFLLWSPEAAASAAVAREIAHAVKHREATNGPRLHPVVVKPDASLPRPPHVPSDMLWEGRFTSFLK